MQLRKAAHLTMPFVVIVLGILIAVDIMQIPGLALASGTALIKVSASRDGKPIAASVKLTEWEGKLLGTGTTPCQFVVAAKGSGYTSYFVICTWGDKTKRNGAGVLEGSTLNVRFDFTEASPPSGPTRYYLDIYAATQLSTTPATGKHWYDEGIVVSVKAIPDTGYEFSFWYVSDLANLKTFVESANPLNVKMDRNWALTGHASKIQPVPPAPPDEETGNGDDDAGDWRDWLNEAVGSSISMGGCVWLALSAKKYL